MKNGEVSDSASRPKNPSDAKTRPDSLTPSFEYFPISIGVGLGKSKENDVFQFNKDRFCHTVIVGRTGSGKSNLVHQMERSDIRDGAGVAIIATHAEDALYPLSCVPPQRLNDVIVIDATDEEFLPCLNPLGIDTTDQATIQNAIESTLELLKSGSETGWTGPRFDSLMRAALGLIMSVPQPYGKPFIGQLQDVLTDPEEVKGRLKYVTQKSIYDFWTREYPAMQRSQDAGEVTNWALAKATAFVNNRTLAAMFGPGSKTIDFHDIVDKGKILVVLAPASHIGDEPARIIRTWVLMELFEAIMSRGGKINSRGLIRTGQETESLEPFYIYVDEFGEVASDEFARMLSQVRKRNAGMILSLQNLEQLRAFNPRLGHRTSSVLDSVLANAGTVVAYQLGVSDAETLSKRFGVEPKVLQDVKRYKPKAFIRLDGQECGPLELDIPIKSEPDNPSMPNLIMDSLIDRGLLLRVDSMNGRYVLIRGDNDSEEATRGHFDGYENNIGTTFVARKNSSGKQRTPARARLKHYLDEDGEDDKGAKLYLFDDLGVSERWANKFDEAGISTVADLAGYDEDSLLLIDGIGKQAIDELKAGLAKHGLLHVIKNCGSEATAIQQPATSRQE